MKFSVWDALSISHINGAVCGCVIVATIFANPPRPSIHFHSYASRFDHFALGYTYGVLYAADLDPGWE